MNPTALQSQRFWSHGRLDTAGPALEPLENGSPGQLSQREKPTTVGHRQQLGDTHFQTAPLNFTPVVFFNKLLV